MAPTLENPESWHHRQRPQDMPLNEGWMPVKARRLQDWQTLKKHVPVRKQGDVCPNASPKKGMLTMTVILNKNGRTVQCHVCVHRPMCRVTLNNGNPPPPPPPTHTLLKWRFLADFKKYTH